MKLYTCTNFKGRNPVGTAAVIVARDRGHAKRLLTAELVRQGIPQDDRELEMTEVSATVSHAVVLCDGNY